MQTTSRNYHFGRDPTANGRRGHAPQISISDDNHHVTEAIGDMYGDHYSKRDSRPLSFVVSPNSESISTAPVTAANGHIIGTTPSASSRIHHRHAKMQRTASGGGGGGSPAPHAQVNGQVINMANRSNSGKSEHTQQQQQQQLSPTNSLKERSPSETINAHFPLNDIDYESSPNAVAQELNNLAALRRMSMDVNVSGDPDLPAFSPNVGIPNPPDQDADPDDTSRLYWVPASVHPELAPMEFKTFLDKKVKSLKRRSEDRGLSPDGLTREGSGSSLRRRRSMLSRQIDNTNGRGADGYQDGAERLDRRRSQLGLEPMNLNDIEQLVNEPERIIQRLSLEAAGDGGNQDSAEQDDKPILPAIPQGNSLRRSTRTTYRRGGSLRRERGGLGASKRPNRLGDQEGEDSTPSAVPPVGDMGGLSRVQTEPLPGGDAGPENFSRPGRSTRRPGVSHAGTMPISSDEPSSRQSPETSERPREGPKPRHFVSQISSNGRLGVPPETLHSKTVPSIVETPPEEQRPLSQSSLHPERSSSHGHHPHVPQGPMHRTAQSRTNPAVKPNQTLNEMTSHPSPLPGNNTRTDSLSFIPTLTDDKKGEGKKSGKKGGDYDGGKKSGWSWGSLLGNEEKERKRAEEDKKTKAKSGRGTEKPYDATRLDVLQTTMEGSRGRESLVLNRDDWRLEEERKKESNRKFSNGEGKKDKDGFFSSLLGGGKRKADRESTSKKHFSRTLSPEPPLKILRPDIDYNWTRFSILEERAIYRMAHIKLANPRRALHSQVLLSNFMYSYLAKVQQMHPQANLPTSAAQRSQAAQKKDQPEEFTQYQKYQEQQQRQQDDDTGNAQSSTAQQDTAGSFMDMDYDYDSSESESNSYRPQSRASQHSVDGGGNNNSNNNNNNNGYTSTASGTGTGAGTNQQGRRSQQGHGQGQGQAQQYQQSRGKYNGSQPQQHNPYAYQENQFDEPGRDADDDMW